MYVCMCIIYSSSVAFQLAPGATTRITPLPLWPALVCRPTERRVSPQREMRPRCSDTLEPNLS